jgi:arylsulfatase A-like enzyme
MNRRQFLSAFAAAPLAMAADKKPNLVLLVGDDLGYGDLGCYGGKDIPTPHLDSLAKNGVRFTDGYVSCPVCSPTRAGLMTGRYQQRFGHELNPGPAAEAADNFGLPLTETAMPARLKAMGYATGMFGKWHLGYREPFRPMQRGFDRFYGFLGGAHSYLDARSDTTNPILDGEAKVDAIEYTTDEFGRRAAQFVEDNRSRPFFLYLPFNAVHTPMHSLPKYEDRFATIQDPKRRTFAAMLAAMDDAVGLVLAALKKHKLTDNTLIVFHSDNGGPTAANTSTNGPLRGFKGQVLEGGIRIPYIMQWPARIPKGKTYEQPVIQLDILPTFAAAAGKAAGADWKLDGVDLLPYVTGKNKGRPHETLYWRYGQQWAVRQGDWKLMSLGAAPEMYNLAADIGEKKDLSFAERGRMADLSKVWEEWNAKNVPPAWSGRDPNPQKAGKKKKKKG